MRGRWCPARILAKNPDFVNEIGNLVFLNCHREGEVPRPNDGAWFHVVLVRVPLANMKLLREQERKRREDRVSVQTRTISVPRFAGRTPNGAFGVYRLAVQSTADAVDLAWKQPMPHGRSHARTSVALIGQCVVLEFGDYLVIAQAFTNEGEARAWAQERHELPLPRAA